MFKKFVSACSSLALTLGLMGSAKNPENMSLDEKIGQMICLDFRFWNSTDLQKSEDEFINIISTGNSEGQKPVTKINDEIKEIIAEYHIGSVILFSQNFENKEQSKRLINDLRWATSSSGNPKLIIAVDQEGGKVERFTFDRGRFKDNAEIGSSFEAFAKGQAIGEELRKLGINCDLAPVLDDPQNPAINVRSFGDDAEIVSKFGKSFMDGLHSENIMSAAKHFPGHSDSSVDPHLGLSVVNKTLQELENSELKPFQTIINAGVDIIMTAHIELPKIENKTVISKKDGEKVFLPATLSKTILTDLLRKKMGFKGVIMTDAMNMKAISENFGELDATKMAIKAGADLICMPVTLRSKADVVKLDKIFEFLKDAVNNGEISEQQINESVNRLSKLKNKYPG